MITRPTVFVLGAGASVGYGFPSGAMLCQTLLEGRTVNINGPSRPLRLNSALEIVAQHILFDYELGEAFVRELRASGCLSIDEFLALREEFDVVGKLAIAAELIRFENPETFANVADKSESFYHQLLQTLLQEGADGFAKNKLTVVTFNYDRSFEEFLYQALRARYGEATAHALFGVIRVIHPHGCLGDYVWNGNAGRPFDQRIGECSLRTAAAGIRIIHETEPTEGAFQLAKDAIENAAEVYFLGFAYHDSIMKRLLGDSPPKANLYGSSMGLSDRRCGFIRDNYHVNMIGEGFGRTIVPYLRQAGLLY